jgi:membrane protein DedA with SNARE-associated domain
VFNTTALWIYLGIFASLVAAGLGFPIPEEIPIVTAGVLAGHAAERPPPAQVPVSILSADPHAAFPGQVPWGPLAKAYEDVPASPVRWWVLLPVCILGVVISDGLLYGAGFFWGLRVLRFPWIRRLLPPDRFEHIQNNFQKRGVLILLFARLLPGIRSPIFLTAGIMRLPLRRFLLADGIYAIPGVSLLFSLAYWFTDSFMELVVNIKHELDKARLILILSLIAAVAVYFLIHFLRRPVPTGDPKEIPLIGGPVAATIEAVERKHGAHSSPATSSSEPIKKEG